MDILQDAVISYRKERAMRYLEGMFREQYKKRKTDIPAHLERREWGFFPFFRGGMRRHIAFESLKDMQDHLIMDTPRHAYYSSAFYERPNAAKMDDKKWLGAELVFDLDADHIPGAEEISYEQQLEAVKREVIKLLEKFILGSFGFDPRDIELVFSGGRGYHIHVNHDSVYKLGSKERREIVDFITATGLDEDWLFPRRPLDKKTFGRHTTVRFIREMPDNGYPGWKGILARGVEDLMGQWESAERGKVLKYLRQFVKEHEIRDAKDRGYGKTTIERTYDDLFKGANGKRGIDKMRKGIFEIFSEDRSRNFFMDVVKKNVSVNLAGETDQPVTTDTHRLIRAPNTLHGKTGFSVVPIEIDNVRKFDPLHDAVVLPSAEVTVEGIRKADIELKGRKYSISPEVHEIPGFAAAYFIASGSALLPRESTR